MKRVYFAAFSLFLLGACAAFVDQNSTTDQTTDASALGGVYDANGVFTPYCSAEPAPVIFTKEGFPIIDDQACIPEPEVLGEFIGRNTFKEFPNCADDERRSGYHCTKIKTTTTTPTDEEACDDKGDPWAWIDGVCVDTTLTPEELCDDKGDPWAWIDGVCVDTTPTSEELCDDKGDPWAWIDGVCVDTTPTAEELCDDKGDPWAWIDGVCVDTTPTTPTAKTTCEDAGGTYKTKKGGTVPNQCQSPSDWGFTADGDHQCPDDFWELGTGGSTKHCVPKT